MKLDRKVAGKSHRASGYWRSLGQFKLRLVTPGVIHAIDLFTTKVLEWMLLNRCELKWVPIAFRHEDSDQSCVGFIDAFFWR